MVQIINNMEKNREVPISDIYNDIAKFGAYGFTGESKTRDVLSKILSYIAAPGYAVASSIGSVANVARDKGAPHDYLKALVGLDNRGFTDLLPKNYTGQRLSFPASAMMGATGLTQPNIQATSVDFIRGAEEAGKMMLDPAMAVARYTGRVKSFDDLGNALKEYVEIKAPNGQVNQVMRLPQVQNAPTKNIRQFTKAIKKLTQEDIPFKKIVEEGGGKYVGIQRSPKGEPALIMFNDASGSTNTLRPNELTAEGVATKIGGAVQSIPFFEKRKPEKIPFFEKRKQEPNVGVFVKLDDPQKEWVKVSKQRIKNIDNLLSEIINHPERKQLEKEKYILSLNNAYIKKGQTSVRQAKKDYADFLANEKVSTKVQQIPKSRHGLPSELSDKKVMHSNHIGVPIVFQGRGIGSELLRSLEKKATINGAEAIVFTEILPPAEKFYIKNGYILYGGPHGIAYKVLQTKSQLAAEYEAAKKAQIK